MAPSPFWLLGCTSGLTSIALGAFGAHALKARVSDPSRITNFQTAAHYQLIHSLAILVAETAAPRTPGAAFWAKTLFTSGIAMFSGSIYLLVLDPVTWKGLGPVTPLGGMCLMGGWVALGVAGRGRIGL